MRNRPFRHVDVGRAAIILLATFLAHETAFAQNPTRLASVHSGGGQADHTSGITSPAISADGRHVAFDSAAGNLVDADINFVSDVFVHDLATGRTVRVSVNSAGIEANDRSDVPAISGDGRYVAFRSIASNLVAFDGNDTLDVFRHDRDPDGNGVFDEKNGVTIRVSVSSSGAESLGHSQSPSISADGRYVAFSSNGNYLDPRDDPFFTFDAFVRDVVAQTTTLENLTPAGNKGNGESDSHGLSGDGRFLLFSSASSDLVPSDTNGAWDLFRRDRVAGVTIRVSLADSGAEADLDCGPGSISDDGGIVAFESLSTNLVAGDTNASNDVFARDVASGRTTRISVDDAGAEANSDSWGGRISADGRWVAFNSRATNLFPGDDNLALDAFVHDRVTNGTRLVSGNVLGDPGEYGGADPSPSGDGTRIAFASDSANLVAGDANFRRDVFVLDVSIPLVDASWKNYGAGLAGTSGVPSLTASGDPEIDATISIDVSNSAGATTAGFLVAGLSDANVPSTLGGTILVGELFAILPLAIPPSGASIPATIPHDLALYGFEVFAQAYEFDAGATRGVSFTRGLELLFGL